MQNNKRFATCPLFPAGRVKFSTKSIVFHATDCLRVIAANPDASPIWGLAPARTYELTNSFEF